MTFNVVFFLPPPSGHTDFTCSINACFHSGSVEGRLLCGAPADPNTGVGVTRRKCTIWSVLKPGSTTHALTSSDVMECVASATSIGTPSSVTAATGG